MISFIHKFMLRTRRYKYVAFSEGHNPEMLFDLDADPGETKNLARNPATREVLNNHRLLLAEWIEKANDNFTVPNQPLKPMQ